jgi:hypothetical protein
MSHINRIRAIENAIERRKGKGKHLDTSNRRLVPDSAGVVTLPADATAGERRLHTQVAALFASMLPPSEVKAHLLPGTNGMQTTVLRPELLAEQRQHGPTPRWWPLRGHVEQQKALTCGARFVGLDAARRTGKTDVSKRFLVAHLPMPRPWPDPRFLYGLPTRDQAKRVAWHDLLRLIPDDWIEGGKLGRNVSYGELWVRTRWGSELWVLGMDQPARFEGSPWDGGVLDEAADLPEGCFDLHVRPALETVENGVNRRGWCWIIGKPGRKGPDAKWFKDFCEKCRRGEYPDGAAFTWPSSDILPADVVKQARETMSAKDFAEQYNASWQTVGGGVWYAFFREFNVRPCERRDNLPIIVGGDFNIGMQCWTLSHRLGDIFETFDELVLRDMDTPLVLNELWKRYGHHKGGWQFYGDASARQRQSNQRISNYAFIWNDQRFMGAGRTLHYRAANPPTRDRVSAANARLSSADGNHRAFIDPRCVKLIEDLETRAYKEGTEEFADGKEQGHISDGWSYPLCAIWPIRLNVGGGTQTVIVGGEPKEFMRPALGLV